MDRKSLRKKSSVNPQVAASDISAPVAQKQATLNVSTRGQWQMYGSHRQAIERLIVSALPLNRGRICVLGAGNCNDLDLVWLTTVFSEVHLADIDPAALKMGIKRQRMSECISIHRHSPFDLTGISPRVDEWRGRTPDDTEIDAAIREIAAAPALCSDGGFDVVLSPCVLSQLFNPARDALGATHPRFGQLLATIRSRHLRMLIDLTAPGGRAILVNDVSSSERFAPLPRVPNDQLPDVLRKVLGEGKCFKGLEPAAMISGLRSDPRVVKWETSPPWLWHLGMERTYLVYAILLWHEFSTRVIHSEHGFKTRAT